MAGFSNLRFCATQLEIAKTRAEYHGIHDILHHDIALKKLKKNIFFGSLTIFVEQNLRKISEILVFCQRVIMKYMTRETARY